MNKCAKCGVVYNGAEIFCPKDGTRLPSAGGEKKTYPSIPPDHDPLVGSVIQGRYRVIQQIGEGGMGVVYTAEHVEIEKMVALKVLRDDFSKRPEVVARFRQEARAASRIGHANIVDVTDFGQLDDGGVYFVMEYLKGQGLSDLIRGKPLELERAAPIISQIARALHAAHKLEIVHRDLKPENVFLVEREENRDFVKVLDFGIAKISDRDSDGKRLTKTGMIFGTPEYMSPEQAAGRPLDHRVDVYALGCIMFEMFTGQVPYDGESFMAVLTQHMFEPVPIIEEINPETDVPEEVRDVVYKAMAKEADTRHSDMSELQVDLERALIESGIDFEHSSTEISTITPLRALTRGGKTAASKATGVKARTVMDKALPSSFEKKTSRLGGKGIALIIVVLVLIAGGGAAFFMGLIKGDESGAPVSMPAAAAGMQQNQVIAARGPESVKEATDTAVVEAKAESDTGIKADDKPKTDDMAKIAVTIKSNPDNAVISVDGLGQVCSKAPCEIQLKEGEPVEIKATLGNREARMTFTPSKQNREVTMEIKKKQRRGGDKRRSDKKGGGRQGDRGGAKPDSDKKQGGLKIPDVFMER